jgi:hypothetical protein
MEFLTNQIKLISSWPSQRKFRVCGEGELPTSRNTKARVPQGSILSLTQYNSYMNDTPQAIDVHLVLFADDTCLYATHCKEGYVLRKFQCGLSSVVAWCEHRISAWGYDWDTLSLG